MSSPDAYDIGCLPSTQSGRRRAVATMSLIRKRLKKVLLTSEEGNGHLLTVGAHRRYAALNRLDLNQLEVLVFLFLRLGFGLLLIHDRTQRVGLIDEQLLDAFKGFCDAQCHPELR